MIVNYVTDDKVTRSDAHFEHAIDQGIGFGQLWVVGQVGTFHLEFTKSGLVELAREAQELADNL